MYFWSTSHLRMLKQIKERFRYRVEEGYEEQFYEKLHTNNLERAYLISIVGGLLFFMLIISDALGKEPEVTSFIPFVANSILALILIPFFFVQRNPRTEISYLYKNKRTIVYFSIAVLTFSLLPMALISVNNTESVIILAVFSIIINLGFKLPRHENLWLNLIALIIVTLGVIYVKMDEGGMEILATLFECWALMIAVFLIAFYQFHFEIKQFNYEKLLEEKNRIIKSQLEAEFEKKIAEVEMTALRAQMNPHFLFNVLNSIKLYMVQNDARTASRYLTKFARLIRLILSNSKLSVVKLSEELSALHLYIEMENFRFNKKFDYTIQVDEQINPDEVDIPPMILQPYVENAIWHGLMHKEEGSRQLTIDIYPDESKKGIYFIIEDNGIGRDKAAQIKTRTATRHKSVGMEITQDRIAITNKLFDTNATVKIIDLTYKQTGQALGTKVVVHLPMLMHVQQEATLVE